MIVFNLKTESAATPRRKHFLDAGYDLFSDEDITIPKGEQRVVSTGVELLDCPGNVCLQIWSKSGLDSEMGLHVGAGIVDPNYRGEILVLLKNMSNYHVEIEKGEAIAQLIPVLLYKESSLPTHGGERGNDGGITRFREENNN